MLERPTLAPSAQLVGELKGSGFKDRQWLIQYRGQYIQVPELLYRVAELANGERSLDQIAVELTESTEWLVTRDHVQILIQKLTPLGVLDTANGPDASSYDKARSRQEYSALGLNLRIQALNPRIITPVAKALQVFYVPAVLISVLIAIAAGHGWLYFTYGYEVIRSALTVLYTPELLLAVLGIVAISGVFHEFGHAAALQYGGGQVRGMGVGLYLIYPVFYTDTTDSYRLDRWARVRTGLGGFYFHLIFALGLIGLYLVTGQEFLLLVVVLINLDILIQSLPFVRYDGYWTLADLTGIPDFFSQMKPFLASVLPLRGYQGDQLPSLKTWVKVVFAAYIALTTPILMLLLFLLIRGTPDFLLTAWDSFLIRTEAFLTAQGNGDILAMMASVVQMILLVLPVLGIMYVFYNMGRGTLGVVLNSRASLKQRIASATMMAAIVALAAFLWS